MRAEGFGRESSFSSCPSCSSVLSVTREYYLMYFRLLRRVITATCSLVSSLAAMVSVFGNLQVTGIAATNKRFHPGRWKRAIRCYETDRE